MLAIVAVDKNWAIGKNGQLLQAIRADLRRFKEITSGHPLIYGRKTLETFPGSKPLPKRRNLMLTTKPERYAQEGLESFSTLSDLLAALSPDEQAEAFVIGGSSVYELLLPYTDKVYVTEIDYAFDAADAYFHNLALDKAWACVECASWQNDPDSGVNFRYTLYERVKRDVEAAS